MQQQTVLPASLAKLVADAEAAEAARVEAEHAALRQERAEILERRAARLADTVAALERFDTELDMLATATNVMIERRRVFEIARQQEAERIYDGRIREIGLRLRDGIGDIRIDFVGRPKLAATA